MIEVAEGARTKSYGEGYQPTLVDRFGVWLSARQIHRYVPDFRGKRIGDFGFLADVSIATELRNHPKVRGLTGPIPEVLSEIESQSLDVILCISVLEHLWEPSRAIAEFHRILAPGGVCLLNVPSWRGKWFLEYSAFRLGFSPAEEMNDHKCYYDVKDFWPLLVRAGFRPSDIRCFSHKFGLNTFAVCRSPK